MTAICPTCGAECRIVSSSRHPGIDGTNYYAPVYNEDVYTSLLEMVRWFGGFPEMEPDYAVPQVQREVDAAIERATKVFHQTEKARAS